jgi:hypothetical protein
VTEKQTFQEGFRQSAAVDRQEEFVFAIAVSVQGKSNELLARPAVPSDQHGGLRVGHFLDHLQHIANGFALPDNIFQAKFHTTSFDTELKVSVLDGAMMDQVSAASVEHKSDERKCQHSRLGLWWYG